MQQYARGGYAGNGTEQPEKQEQATPPRFCRKCFLHEMELQGGLKKSYEDMLERIEMMDPELRCTGEAYEARLLQCKKCEYLAEGMCALCGCFAESRAAVKANSCPANPKRWEAEVIDAEIR